MPIQIGFLTDKGKVRSVNEDSVFVDIEQGLALVADGMGGNARGDLASKIAIEQFPEWLRKGQTMPEAMKSVHAAILDKVEVLPSAKGMATTMVSARLSDDSYTITWVGDSRAYLLRKNKLIQLTQDHSYLQFLLNQGVPLEKAKSHGKANVVVQSLGLGNPKPDECQGDFNNNDVLILCSDGLTNEIDDREIASTVSHANSVQTAAESLVEKALLAGGKDNVSVVCIAGGELGSRGIYASLRSILRSVLSGRHMWAIKVLVLSALSACLAMFLLILLTR